jgi:putative endonuclease
VATLAVPRHPIGAYEVRLAMEKGFYVYIMTNPRRTVLYTGVTNNLPRRVYEHKTKLTPGFAARYNVINLVYYEVTETAEAAITREKQLKAGSRRQKIELINSMNPTWQDLSAEL